MPERSRMPRTSFLRAFTTIAEGRWRTIISLLMRGQCSKTSSIILESVVRSPRGESAARVSPLWNHRGPAAPGHTSRSSNCCRWPRASSVICCNSGATRGSVPTSSLSVCIRSRHHTSRAASRMGRGSRGRATTILSALRSDRMACSACEISSWVSAST